MKTELIKPEEGKNVKIQFYVTLPPEGRVLGSKAEKIYGNLGTSELWDDMGRDVSSRKLPDFYFILSCKPVQSYRLVLVQE